VEDTKVFMMNTRLRNIFWIVLLALIQIQPVVLAHHRLQKDIDEILGPLAWGMYLILPIPFLVIGSIAFLVWRAIRRETVDGKRPWESTEPLFDPKLN